MISPSTGLEALLARITPEAVRALALRLLAGSTHTRSVTVTALIAELCAGSDLGAGGTAAAVHEALREAIQQAVAQTPELRYVAASA
jgi:hypothetical protein